MSYRRPREKKIFILIGEVFHKEEKFIHTEKYNALVFQKNKVLLFPLVQIREFTALRRKNGEISLI